MLGKAWKKEFEKKIPFSVFCGEKNSKNKINSGNLPEHGFKVA